MEQIINSDCQDYLKYIVTPITPYLICDHYLSTEVLEHDSKYIGLNIHSLFTNDFPEPNDLYKNNNFDSINDGDIVQVQVDFFYSFVINVLPRLTKRIILITSQWHLPQLHRNEITDICLNNDKIILWISQNPIYANHPKYMPFPYGLYLGTVNEYMNYLKKNNTLILDTTTTKDMNVYNSHINIHPHLPANHIRRHPIFKDVRITIPYEEYLNRVLRSKFTISTGGDRDDCYRHYECIGLNSIPISNIRYTEIFENNMIYSNIDDIIKIINGEMDIHSYKINRDILTLDYWKNKIDIRRFKCSNV